MQPGLRRQLVIGKTKVTLPRPAPNKVGAAAASLFTEGASLDLHRSADSDSLVVSGQPLLKAPEEALVADTRAGLTPSQHVERKLISLLKTSLVPISHVQIVATGIRRKR
jgi:hypothetical protein